MRRIKLGHDEWEITERIGSGGFGEVFRVTCGAKERALKLVPKSAGAERELLFVDLGNVRNVVPVIESGEVDTSWALLMPLAEGSLNDRVTQSKSLPIEFTVSVLRDVCTALADLSNSVVHRDIKPANILLLDGKWCLADFGIARYAEATTDEATKKFGLLSRICG